MYSGYLLTNESKQFLLELFPPRYPDVYAHHITEKFGIKDDSIPPKAPNTVYVVGYINDRKSVEGLLIEINGTTKRRSGGNYHITWSLDKKLAKPVDTNKFTDNATQLNKKIQINVLPKIFKY